MRVFTIISFAQSIQPQNSFKNFIKRYFQRRFFIYSENNLLKPLRIKQGIQTQFMFCIKKVFNFDCQYQLIPLFKKHTP